jgi:hypothetical protein
VESANASIVTLSFSLKGDTEWISSGHGYFITHPYSTLQKSVGFRNVAGLSPGLAYIDRERKLPRMQI